MEFKGKSRCQFCNVKAVHVLEECRDENGRLIGQLVKCFSCKKEYGIAEVSSMGIEGPLPKHILDKMDPKDRKLLGKAGMTYDEAVEAQLSKDERADHIRIMSWVKRNELECIHAPTFRRVHDLPPGWPDFTLVWGDRHLFCELKSASGRLSEAQLAMKAKLEAQGATVYVKHSYDQVRRLFEGWLWEIARWKPAE